MDLEEAEMYQGLFLSLSSCLYPTDTIVYLHCVWQLGGWVESQTWESTVRNSRYPHALLYPFPSFGSTFPRLVPFSSLCHLEAWGPISSFDMVNTAQRPKNSFDLLPCGLIFTLFNFLSLSQILLEIDGQKSTQTYSPPSLSYSLAHILLSFPRTWRPAKWRPLLSWGRRGVVSP